MTTSDAHSTALYDFIGHVARADTMDELQARYLDGVGTFVESFAAGLYVLSPFTSGAESVAAKGVSDFFLSRYEEHGRSEDPVLREAISAGRPVDNRQLLTLEQWNDLPIYRDVFRLHRMSNLLEAPVIVDGVPLGTLNFGRTEHEGRFTFNDHMMAEVLAHLLGVALTSVRDRTALVRERDQTLAALELCTDAIIVTDLHSAERRMNAAARRLLARLSDGDAGLDDLLTQPVRMGEATRHEAHVVLVDGSAALLSARSTNTSDTSVLVTFLDLVSGSEPRALTLNEQNLTRRERQVAELAAGGLHDAEIADHLHLSRHTVKQYLKAVYSKLGIRSRVDLTRLVMQSNEPLKDLPGAPPQLGPSTLEG